MILREYLDIAELNEDVEAGYIDERVHPDLPLRMYTYSRSAQYDSHWTDATSKCRGLIVEDNTDKIIAFCMPKFHNKSEHDNGKSYAPELPVESFKVFDKVDGSMGTVYNYAGQWKVATKGSFLSDQAVKATKMLNASLTNYLIPGFTYVVEIIYPENRIVVDYKTRQDLVLLTSFRPDGVEVLHPDEWEYTGFSNVKDFADCSFLSIDSLVEEPINGTEAEGFVIRFQSGRRVKLKYAEYLALHKILTNCTERTIWEALYSRTDMAKFRENVPDEFDEWVEETTGWVLQQVSGFNFEADRRFMQIVHRVGAKDRKAFALEAAKEDQRYKSAMFLLYDGKSTRDLAFKLCYPKAIKPFRQDDE